MKIGCCTFVIFKQSGSMDTVILILSNLTAVYTCILDHDG